jgi:Ca2+-binding RTX toxin-like protein
VAAATSRSPPRSLPKAWKAAWSPDSQTLYYSVGDINQNPNGNTNDIKLYQQPANNSSAGTELLHVSGAHVFQPSISPDGTKMCFTHSTAMGNSTTASVLVVPVNAPGSPPTIIADSGVGDYNCTWSPDGSKIAYTEDFGANGEVFMEESDGSSLFPIDLTNVAGMFEGNPDWAPDARPECPDSTVNTTTNTPITFQVTCNDTGPAYEQSEVREFGKTSPSNGTLTQEFAGDPFTYTPNQGFAGTDSFQVQSFDEFGFGADTGTVTINVRSPQNPPPPPTVRCAGRTATIVGTTGADVLTGTGGRDVIAALGGNDRVRAGRGNDLVCAGFGRDRVAGGRGRDSLRGGTGQDTLSGNSGNDSLKGGPGRDTLIGGTGRDRLNGGPSRDVCRGGLGHDAGSRCERRSSIP